MIDGDFYAKLGEKARELRKKAGMTQGAVSEKLGIHQTDLSAFESKGERIRSAEKINEIFELFGYTIFPSEKKLY